MPQRMPPARLNVENNEVDNGIQLAIYPDWSCKSEVSLSSGTSAGAPGDLVGTHLVKKRASAAASTTTNSAALSAARRPSAFICNTASMVACVAPYASRLIRTAVAETNGTPAPNVVCASALRLSGMLGLASTPCRTNVVTTEIITEPTRAVPSEAP